MGCCFASNSKDEGTKYTKRSSHRSKNSSSRYNKVFEYSYIKDNFIARLSSSKPTSILTLPIILPESPACTLLNEECMMIAGGHIHENTTQTYLINTRTGHIHNKLDLPIAIRQGNLHYGSNKVYHVGGLLDTQDPYDSVVPAPFLCYDITEDLWTVLEIAPENDRTVVSKSSSNDYLMPTLLRSPGSFMLNRVIYFIGGIFKTTTGQKVTNNSIITYNLETSKVGRCKVTLDFEILVPKCLVISSNKVIIAGGIDPNILQPSKKAYLFTVDERIQPLPNMPYDLFDHAPGKFVAPYLMFAHYPYVQIYDSHNKHWRVESIIHMKHEQIITYIQKIERDVQEDDTRIMENEVRYIESDKEEISFGMLEEVEPLCDLE